MRSSGASVIPNTCEWEQYDWNKSKKQSKNALQADRVEMEISKAGTKENKSRRPNCLSGLPYPVVTISRSREWIT